MDGLGVFYRVLNRAEEDVVWVRGTKARAEAPLIGGQIGGEPVHEAEVDNPCEEFERNLHE